MGARPQHKPQYRHLQKLLKSWRMEAGLSQRALAAKLQQPHSYVDKSESGIRRVDAVEFKRWCLACGVDPHEAIDQVRA